MTQRELERQLSKIYGQARKKIAKYTQDYFEQFQARDKAMRGQVADGIISKKEYKQWLDGQKAYMQRNKELLDAVSKEYRNADITAARYINGQLPYSYVSGYTATGKGIAGEVTGYSYSLIDKNAVMTMIGEGDIPIATYTAETGKHMAYVDKRSRQAITSGIISGDSVDSVSRDVMKALGNVTEKERKAVIRNTRTLMNGAHNAGAYAAMEDATKDGIILDKQWIATHDERTRESHIYLDGEIRKWNEKFSNGLRFPQDPTGRPEEVYNCRCSYKEITRGFYNKYTGKTELIDEAPAEEYRKKSQEYWDKVEKEKNAKKQLPNTEKSSKIKEERNMAYGGRTSVHHILTDEEISKLISEAESIDIPTSILRFNEGERTGFVDTQRIINVRGNILPDSSSTFNRDTMTSRACLAHEYYGHYMNYPSKFEINDWRDEFKASYDAALNTPNLTKAERQSLMIDAYDRAKEAGVSVKYNEKARSIIYGYD